MSFEEQARHIISIAVTTGYGVTQERLPDVVEDNLLLILTAHNADKEAAVRERDEALEGMVLQFGYETTTKDGPAIWHGGLSALEDAFEVLGWESPHSTPFRKCMTDGCNKHAHAGTPTPDGYKWLCSEHYAQLQGEDGKL